MDRRSPLLLAMVLLAGCTASTAPPSPTPDSPADGVALEPSVLADLASASCVYNDVIFLMPRERVQALLPEGFRARPLFSDATGAIVTNIIACEEGFAWEAADTFAIVERITPPAWMETFDSANRTPREETPPESSLYLDIYMLAGFTEHEALIALFERGGMPVTAATVAKTALPAPVGSLAQGSVTDAAGPLLSYSVEGRPLGDLTASHRQWRETPDGLLLVERHMTSNGDPIALTQGAAQCVVRPGTVLAEITGGVPCSLGQDMTNGFSWEGRAYLFPGTSGATFDESAG